MTLDLNTIKQGLIEEVDAHAKEIEDGRYSWFQVKIFLNRGEISSNFQCEEKNRVIQRPRFIQEVFVNPIRR